MIIVDWDYKYCLGLPLKTHMDETYDLKATKFYPEIINHLETLYGENDKYY